MSMSAKEKDELYYFDDGPDLSKQYPNTCLNSTFVSQDDDIMLWHYRLGHLSYKPTTPFTAIHSDIWGPYKISTIFDKKLFVTFIDYHRRLSRELFIRVPVYLHNKTIWLKE
ncbi:hypothetical protein CR513_00942, partial [Mucuna pruriens]